MKTEKELNEKILEITGNIRENHPELLKYLNEMSASIPYEENQEITVESLTSYYQSLISLVEEYEKNHDINLLSVNDEKILVNDNREMKVADSYQNLWADVNNITLSYYDVGESNIPVIFLHGFPFNKSMWKDQLDGLKSSNRLIAYDIRGFGESTDETTALSIDLFCDDLILFMDKLNIEKAIVCGLSMGGYIALSAIKRFPERFEALILCDTQCIADSPEVKEKRLAAIEQINLDGEDVFNEKFIKSVFHTDSLTNKIELVENLRNIVFANSKGIITAGLTALAERSETCSTLDDIRIPTLLICGRLDEVTPLIQSEFLHKHINGSILKIIENAGHVSNYEQPEEFNTYIGDFLSSLHVASSNEPSVLPKTI